MKLLSALLPIRETFLAERATPPHSSAAESDGKLEVFVLFNLFTSPESAITAGPAGCNSSQGVERSDFFRRSADDSLSSAVGQSARGA
jgi:hypothetical protein